MFLNSKSDKIHIETQYQYKTRFLICSLTGSTSILRYASIYLRVVYMNVLSMYNSYYVISHKPIVLCSLHKFAPLTT